MPFDPSTFDPSAIPFMQIAFWVMTVFAIGGAIGVVASKSLFHSALFLIMSFFGVTGYYAILSAGFLAAVQLMIYIGAIAILILFAIMFSRRLMGLSEGQSNTQWWFSLPIAFILFFILYGVVTAVDWPVSGEAPTEDSVLQLGLAFLGSYLIPFMVVSVLLSVALIGAVFLAREKTDAEEAF
jgi:NADH:ubiquinone oxidoreductase subunit 6 (subunit J)